MTTLFLACAVLGGAILLLQLLLGLLGLAHDGHDLGHGHELSEGLNLLSVRALSAGVAFFGLTGIVLSSAGLPRPLAFIAALAVGFAATTGVALIMRALGRLEDDGTVRIENALGLPATVYVSIPGERAGAGKVLLELQARTVELQAVTAQEQLPTGTPVTVVDVLGPDTVEVVVTPSLGEMVDGDA